MKFFEHGTLDTNGVICEGSTASYQQGNTYPWVWTPKISHNRKHTHHSVMPTIRFYESTCICRRLSHLQTLAQPGPRDPNSIGSAFRQLFTLVENEWKPRYFLCYNKKYWNHLEPSRYRYVMSIIYIIVYWLMYISWTTPQLRQLAIRVQIWTDIRNGGMSILLTSSCKWHCKVCQSMFAASVGQKNLVQRNWMVLKRIGSVQALPLGAVRCQCLWES